MFSVRTNLRQSPASVESTRAAKRATRAEIELIYKRYAEEGLTFEQIVESESNGYALAILKDGLDMRAQRRAHLRGGEASALAWIPTTLDTILRQVQRRLGIPPEDAARQAVSFVASEHLRSIPFSRISARLHAALAMLCRGTKTRLPLASDSYDIDHVATFLPYVDVFIADRFFADLANQGHLRLGQEYKVTIRSLRPSEVDGFIAWLEELVKNSPVAGFSEEVYQAIGAGGFHQEFAEYAREYLRSHNLDEEE